MIISYLCQHKCNFFSKIKDFHTCGHSRNPVPLLAWGKHGEFLRTKTKNLSDVTPALLELFPRKDRSDNKINLTANYFLFIVKKEK
jgi:hypothetical protein